MDNPKDAAKILGRRGHKRMVENTTEEDRKKWALRGAMATKRSWKNKRHIRSKKGIQATSIK